jgi:hypothetical protein
MRWILLLIAGSALWATPQIYVEDVPYGIFVGARAQLDAYALTAAGLRVRDGIRFSSSDPAVLSASNEGELLGVHPGEAQVTIRHDGLDLTLRATILVTPARLQISAGNKTELTAGETVELAAQAWDAAGRVIPNLRYQYSVSWPHLARVEGNRVTAIAPGHVFLTGQIEGLPRHAGAFATVGLWLQPKPLYRFRTVFDSRTPQNVAPISYSRIAAANNRVAVIAGFENGGQAAVLIDGSETKVLAWAGQSVGETGTVILRLNHISINQRGDVAVLADMSSYHCAASLLFVPKGGTLRETPIGCSGEMDKRALSSDSSFYVLSYDSGHILYRGDAEGNLTKIAGARETIAGLGAITRVHRYSGNSDGTLLAQIESASGQTFYGIYDGAKWIRAFSPGDVLSGVSAQHLDSFVGNGAGLWYFRASGENFSVIMSVDLKGQTKVVLPNNFPSEGEVVHRWPHRLLDAEGSSFVLAAHATVNNRGNDYLTTVTVGEAPKLHYPMHWDSVLHAGILGTTAIGPIVRDGSLRLERLLASGTSGTVLLGPSQRLPVPASTVWRDFCVAGRDGQFRGADDGLIGIADLKPVVAGGSAMPNQTTLSRIHHTVCDPSGQTVFMSSTFSSQATVFARNAGRTRMVVDGSQRVADTSGRTLNYLEWWHRPSLAVNGRGDVAYGAYFNNVRSIMLQRAGEAAPRPLLTAATALPDGAGFPQSSRGVSLNEAGEATIWNEIPGGPSGLYATNGGSLRTLVSPKQPFEGASVSTIHQFCARNNQLWFHLARPSGEEQQAVSSGAAPATLSFTDLDRGGMSFAYPLGLRCEVGATGEVVFLGQSSDGRPGLFHFTPKGNRASAIAYVGQQLGADLILINAYGLSLQNDGTFYFTAHVYSATGGYSMAVFEATPLP